MNILLIAWCMRTVWNTAFSLLIVWREVQPPHFFLWNVENRHFGSTFKLFRCLLECTRLVCNKGMNLQRQGCYLVSGCTENVNGSMSAYCLTCSNILSAVWTLVDCGLPLMKTLLAWWRVVYLLCTFYDRRISHVLTKCWIALWWDSWFTHPLESLRVEGSRWSCYSEGKHASLITKRDLFFILSFDFDFHP